MEIELVWCKHLCGYIFFHFSILVLLIMITLFIYFYDDIYKADARFSRTNNVYEIDSEIRI